MKTQNGINTTLRINLKQLFLSVIMISFIGVLCIGQTMSRSDRLFIKHGIQYQSWMGTDDTTSEMPLGTEYSGLNLTAPAWFGGDLFYQGFFDEFPNANWSMEKAPYTDKYIRPPNATEIANGFLSPQQFKKKDQLVCIGFGDEEHYSNNLILSHKQWFELSKNHYPNALVHNNQWGSQWSHAQLRDYMQRAKPDFISYDHYYFGGVGDDNGRKFQQIFLWLSKYRNLAYENTPGNGPINFGFYLQGYKFRGYTMSETQINGQAYLALLFGAKWLNIFRYLKQVSGVVFFYHNPDGSPSLIYDYFSNIGTEIANLSPYLSRLKSKKITIVRGQHISGGKPLNNPIPTGASLWNSVEDKYITNIDAANLGTKNNGLKGDIYIGYFNPVQGLDNTAGITMAPIHSIDTEYFMIMNGLSTANTNNSITNPNGKASTTQQKVTLTIDFGTDPVEVLKRINKSTGAIEDVVLTQVSGSKYTVDITLDGGKADLFYWGGSALSSAEFSKNSGIKIYPNPIKKGEEIFIKFNTNKEQKGKVVLAGCDGKILINKIIDVDREHISIKLPLSNIISTGLYVLKVQIDGEMIHKKIVIE